MSDDLNTKFLKVTGLTWNLEEAIAKMKSAGIPDSEIAKKILWLIPDGSMLDSNGRMQTMAKELLSDDVLSGIGIKESDKIKSGESEEITYEYVDLGLPSGTLWAKQNIQDANGNELYFAWGETQGYTSGQVGTEKNFTWDNYKFGPESALTKYNAADRKYVLDAEDDAAIANWGSNWKMPTKEQFEELISSANTTTAFTEQNGVSGLLLTSKANNNTLFFPAVGLAGDDGVGSVGDYGYYWSVSLCIVEYSSWGLSLRNCRVSSMSRKSGFSVRPVRAK